MKVLVSVMSAEEALAAYEGGADIIDVKNVKEGSLGASCSWVIREIVGALGEREVTLSATLGDLPFKPGTASLAALGAAVSGARYIKAGLHGVSCYEDALMLMGAVVRTCRDQARGVTAVAAGYADYRRFAGLDPGTLVRVAKDSGAEVVMLDTAVKDGRGLFDALSVREIERFVLKARASGLEVALAGSIGIEHLEEIRRLAPDVVGVRGAVCRAGKRTSRIDPGLVERFVEAARASVAL